MKAHLSEARFTCTRTPRGTATGLPEAHVPTPPPRRSFRKKETHRISYEKKRTIEAHLLRGALYLLLLLAVSLIPFALAQRTTAKGNRPATTITVTNGNDSGPGSLRQALAQANDGDTINFDPSVNIVTLTTAEFVITKSITISASPQMVTVQRASQAPQFRIFHVMPGHSVEINDLTISGGHITGDNGGGILNDNSTLTMAHCTVNGNAIVSARREQ